MALYQDGILISGANQLPQMTLAEWQALPSAERPTYWICTDKDYEDMSVVFTEASTRANINSGETLPTLFGKIKKFFSDLKNHAFTALDTGSIDIGGMAGGQQYVYTKGVNDFSYNNGVIQISKRTGYNSYDTELIPVPNSNDYVAKTGDTMTGTLNMNTVDGVAVNFRPNHSGYYTTISYQTAGNEACVFATKSDVTSWIFINGEDSVTNHANTRWQSLTPALQIKENKVAIGKLIAHATSLTYPLEVNGDVLATNFRGDLVGKIPYTHTNEINFKGGKQSIVYFNYRNADTDATDGGTMAVEYRFCNYNNSTGHSTITAGSFNGTAVRAKQDESGNNIKSSYASSMRLTAEGANRLRYELFAKDGAILTVDTVQLNTSSRKYKENIEPLTEDEARKILDIETVIFDYKKDHENYTSRKGYKNIGCIAEDVDKIIPEVVTEDNGVIYGINYTEMIPYLIKMIQIQQKEIEELKAIIKANE